MKHTGTADLPLHGGKVPAWMLRIMRQMVDAIAAYIVEFRGPSALVRVLSDPVWFQAFNNVTGMDWDSSGSTTVLLGVLREVTWSRELGLLVLGGKGARMRSILEEALEAERRLGVAVDSIVRFSRAAARLDSSFLQDGYDLYIHAVVVSEEGEMIVVQQGMNTESRMARRYHVASASFSTPHAGIAGAPSRIVLDATASESRPARKTYLDILSEGASRVQRLLAEANKMVASVQGGGLERFFTLQPNRARMVTRPPRPYYRPVRPTPQLIRAIEELERNPPLEEADLLHVRGLGPRVVRALALIADIIYGVPTSTSDPVSHPLDPYIYAYAIGGKDGVPYKFDPRTAVEAYNFLREAIEEARIGERTRERALRKLHASLRRWLQLAGHL